MHQLQKNCRASKSALKASYGWVSAGQVGRGLGVAAGREDYHVDSSDVSFAWCVHVDNFDGQLLVGCSWQCAKQLGQANVKVAQCSLLCLTHVSLECLARVRPIYAGPHYFPLQEAPI